MVASAFSDAFFPGLWATLIGVAAGLPIALWLNRAVVSHGEKSERKREQQRLAEALRTLDLALVKNAQQLGDLIRVLEEQGNVAVILDVDVATWEAVRSEIIPYLRQPALLSRLAHHFALLANLLQLHRMFLETAIGVSSALG